MLGTSNKMLLQQQHSLDSFVNLSANMFFISFYVLQFISRMISLIPEKYNSFFLFLVSCLSLSVH